MTTLGPELYSAKYMNADGEYLYTPWEKYIIDVTDYIKERNGELVRVMTREGGDMYYGYGNNKIPITGVGTTEGKAS